MKKENHHSTEAVIYLKDGKRKHGVLLNEQTNLPQAFFKFVCNSNISFFNETMNTDYIEFVPESLIESIDTALK